jgi:hypothetical protein
VEPPLSTLLDSAQRFAAALDAEDYESVRALLAANCSYHSPGGLLTGPDAILASYREHGQSASHRFDKIEYRSAVESIGPREALITFVDRVTLRRATHEFRCQQRIRIGVGGLIEEIRHEEIPGERERLREFEASAGSEAARRAITRESQPE